MTDIAVHIAQEQFERAGFMPRFDMEKYQQLVGTLATAEQIAQKPPNVYLAPWQPFASSSILQAMYRVLKPSTRLYGSYDHRTGTCSVFARTAEGANNTLLHEVRHWADEVTGQLDKWGSRREKARLLLPGLAALTVTDCTVPLVTYEITKSPTASLVASMVTGAATIAATVSLMYRRGYRGSSSERRAVGFAANPHILQQFGDIISLDYQHERRWPLFGFGDN